MLKYTKKSGGNDDKNNFGFNFFSSICYPKSVRDQLGDDLYKMVKTLNSYQIMKEAWPRKMNNISAYDQTRVLRYLQKYGDQNLPYLTLQNHQVTAYFGRDKQPVVFTFTSFQPLSFVVDGEFYSYKNLTEFLDSIENKQSVFYKFVPQSYAGVVFDAAKMGAGAFIGYQSTKTAGDVVSGLIRYHNNKIESDEVEEKRRNYLVNQFQLSDRLWNSFGEKTCSTDKVSLVSSDGLRIKAYNRDNVRVIQFASSTDNQTIEYRIFKGNDAIEKTEAWFSCLGNQPNEKCQHIEIDKLDSYLSPKDKNEFNALVQKEQNRIKKSLETLDSDYKKLIDEVFPNDALNMIEFAKSKNYIKRNSRKSVKDQVLEPNNLDRLYRDYVKYANAKINEINVNTSILDKLKFWEPKPSILSKSDFISIINFKFRDYDSTKCECPLPDAYLNGGAIRPDDTIILDNIHMHLEKLRPMIPELFLNDEYVLTKKDYDIFSEKIKGRYSTTIKEFCKKNEQNSFCVKLNKDYSSPSSYSFDRNKYYDQEVIVDIYNRMRSEIQFIPAKKVVIGKIESSYNHIVGEVNNFFSCCLDEQCRNYFNSLNEFRRGVKHQDGVVK